MRTYYKKVLIFGFACLCSYVLYTLIRTVFIISSNNNSVIGDQPAIPKDYMQLFKFDTTLVRNEYTYQDENNNPVSNFEYQNYSVVVTKINTTRDFTIPDKITEEYLEKDESMNEAYTVISKPLYSFKYIKSTTNVNQIFMSISGGPIKVVAKKDSLASYFFKMHKMALHYTQDGLINIISQSKGANVPVNLTF